MSELVFSEGSIPTSSDSEVGFDAALGDSLRCEVCGTALTYGGRGRKPKFCADHKPKRAASKSSKNSASADDLAEQAVEALSAMHGIAATLLMLGGMTDTASTLSQREDAWRAMATNALRQDRALCLSILRAGATGGKGALIIAYALYIGGTVPVALAEIKSKRESRENG